MIQSRISKPRKMKASNKLINTEERQQPCTSITNVISTNDKTFVIKTPSSASRTLLKPITRVGYGFKLFLQADKTFWYFQQCLLCFAESVFQVYLNKVDEHYMN